MKYQDLKFNKAPKFLTWHLVQFRASVRDSVHDEWCREHESPGRFYYRQNHQASPDSWKILTEWYFEQEDDAVLFALKFT